jgi:DNA-binding MarR family transcriptional regulator
MAKTQTQPAAEACAYVVGDDGIGRWSPTHADAWIGLLQTQRNLTRELDAEIEAKHGLGLSALELLGRLAAADDRRLRLSTLAEQTGLSLSRVSRIVDTMESRALVTRVACPSDGRAVNAVLTDEGLVLVRDAQATHFEGVRVRFFDRLEPGEIAALAEIFARFAPGAAEQCTEALAPADAR